MTVTAFISSCRAEHHIPVRVACRALGVSESWYFKHRGRPPTPRQFRRRELAEAVRAAFEASGGTYGSPRVTLELRAAGWRVSANTVAKLMAEAGLVARVVRHRRSLTRHGRRPAAADLVERAFTAERPDAVWVGDVTMIRTGQGPLYLASVLDLFSRRLLGYAMSGHHDAELTVASLQMAAATRGGAVDGVIFHSDRGSEGGLNRSSQHLTIEEVFSGTTATACGSGSSTGDAVTWSAHPSPTCGARVLASDREGQAQRGCGARGRRVCTGRHALVSSRWRHAAFEPGRAHRPLLVVP